MYLHLLFVVGNFAPTKRYRIKYITGVDMRFKFILTLHRVYILRYEFFTFN